ncbi:hypothetical protein PUN28_011212 [Cardiocondyla obscurior]|uniref:BRCT domain-containing protein n=2 Tax=Cardiocondyla obscurior TaxID=286306 RepID=A0AAW2FLC9_9HYME
MSYGKIKIFSSDTSDDESFNHRRSSLKVNLSYNEADSGNGSLWRTEIENDERKVNEQTVRRSSRNKTIRKNYCQSSSNNSKDTQAKDHVNNDCEESIQIEKEIQLRNLTANVSNKERHLETNCKRLKDAILSKTKQIFNKDDELSKKTALILGNTENRLVSNMHNLNSENKTVILDETSTDQFEEEMSGKCIDIINNQQRNNQYINIVTTPKKDDRQRSTDKSLDKSKLLQKRLFTEKDKQEKGQAKCRIIKNVILKKNLPLVSVKPRNQSSSPILSGSNKKCSLFKAQSKLHSQNQIKNSNNYLYSDQDINIRTPIVCSTFIENNAGGRKKTDIDAFYVTTNKVISMEMTDIYGGIHNIEEHVPQQSKNLNTNYCNENNEKEESKEKSICKKTRALNFEDVEQPINKITVQNNTRHFNLLCIDDANNQITKNQTEKRCTTSLFNNSDTVRSSLDMNTSLDAVTNDAKSIKKLKIKNCSSTDTESLSKENGQMNDAESLENISLIERLRNFSMGNQASRNDKSKISKMCPEDKKNSSKSGSSYSYIESTPYPISRSTLFRSRLKRKTRQVDDVETRDGNLNSMDYEEEKDDKTNSVSLYSETSNKMLTPIGTRKIIEIDTLESTSSDNSFITENRSIAVNNTLNGTKSNTDKSNIITQDVKYRPGKSKKKLLPLNENSFCSLSPTEDKNIFEKSMSVKQKKLKKKLPKKKLMSSKNIRSNQKQNTASKQTWSDSDCNIPEVKKKETKTRKPRKIISKKIIIKKYADENVLNILQGNNRNTENHTISNKDSLDDFVKCRTISTQWNKYKSQKIVIVTTGLSIGDKNLVKTIIKSLGQAEMELNVTKRTTHVVSTGVRTVNLLRGIIRGCWLVTLDWVLKSLENNTWLNPETFEMKHFSKAVQENRRDRQLFGSSYIPELFTACGLVYVEHKTTVPCDTLKELIKTAGGHITENIKLAKIVIGANGLKENWVIDSITTGELQSTKLYQRK